MSHAKPRLLAAFPLLICAAGFVLDVSTWWPGHFSFDSAYAWWQAQGGTTSNIMPPIFVMMLRFCASFGTGPGGLFAFHALLFWLGLGLFMRALQAGAGRGIAMVVLVALTPVPWLLRAHVWTDVGLFSALMFATGALACVQAQGRRVWLLMALPAIVYAALLRHNALVAILPFVIVWMMLFARHFTPAMRHPVQALGMLGLLVGIVFLAQALDRRVEWRVAMWPTLAQFDLAGVSLKTHQMLLPYFMIGEGLELEELREAFRPWSNVAMLTSTRHGMADPFLHNYLPGEYEALRAAWFGAIVEHPAAWLEHRWDVTRSLFGTHPREWPAELIYSPKSVPYRDNPAMPNNGSTLHKSLMKAATRLRDTAALAAWPYLLAGFLALPFLWRQRNQLNGQTGLLLLTSAWLYALPLTALAPSAELRYLGWPCLASLLSVCCIWVPRRDTPHVP